MAKRRSKNTISLFPYFSARNDLVLKFVIQVQVPVNVTRMGVPKMVKNGHNSVLHVSANAPEDSYSKKSRTDTKPKTFLKS
jgi:hypothetical protein